MQSGTTGINTIRIYNPRKQSLDQDPSGSFIRAFVPELGSVPDGFVHEPWLWPGASSLPYPAPIVDNASAAKFARETLYGIRKGSNHQQAANELVAKHGSRKGTPSTTGRNRQVKSKATAEKQMAFDF